MSTPTVDTTSDSTFVTGSIITPSIVVPITPTASNAAPTQSTATGPLGAADVDLWQSGLLAALEPGITACDQNIHSVFTAQTALATQIDRLSAAIHSFHSLSKNPSLTSYTNKLLTSKKRVKKAQGDINKINSRLEDIRTMIKKKEGGKTVENLLSQQNQASVALASTASATPATVAAPTTTSA